MCRWFLIHTTPEAVILAAQKMEVCVRSEPAAERCTVSQGPAAWCFLEVFPLCVVGLQLCHRAPRTLMRCQVPWWQQLSRLTDAYNPLSVHTKASRLIRCKHLALCWREPRCFDTWIYGGGGVSEHRVWKVAPKTLPAGSGADHNNALNVHSCCFRALVKSLWTANCPYMC